MADDVMTTIEKTPNESYAYGFDYTGLLAGDTLSTGGTWTSTPSGLTLGVTGFTPTAVSQHVSGGTSGVSYYLTNRAPTVAGNTVERTMIIQIVDYKGK